MIDEKRLTAELISWTRNWFENNGELCNAVIGISGGKDSTVAAAILTRALGKDRVIGVLMPNGIQRDISDSRQVVEHLGIRSYYINIEDAYDSIERELVHAFIDEDIPVSKQTQVNLAPRLRMTALYAVAQSMNGRVVNTCNLSENVLGYSTLYGDHAGDLSLFDQLTVTEIRAIGHYLGLPAELVDKVPADGLSGKTDEEAFGFSYDTLDTFIRTGVCDDTIRAVIMKKYRQNLFKQELIHFPHYDPGLDNYVTGTKNTA